MVYHYTDYTGPLLYLLRNGPPCNGIWRRVNGDGPPSLCYHSDHGKSILWSLPPNIHLLTSLQFFIHAHRLRPDDQGPEAEDDEPMD